MRRSVVLFALLVACSDSSSSAPPDSTPMPERGTPDAAAPVAEIDAGSDAAVAEDLDVPESLVKALGDKTYVEGDCQPATVPGWPYEAQRCTYQGGLVVTIANPTPERVARWIVDASSLIASLDGLHTTDRASWEAGLVVMAKHTIGQSSRIFPLAGKVYENGTAYSFDRGVTSTCSSGCYCRVNSTSRAQWCKYAFSVEKSETSEDACLEKYGQTNNKLTEPWLVHCLDNHIASFNADRNPHYRAQAWNANVTMGQTFGDPSKAKGADVLAALKKQYPAN